MNYVPYKTVGGDTWSSVAYKAYGDETKSDLIIQANTAVKVDYILPAGIVLQVPVDDSDASIVNVSVLPPWK